MGTFGEADRTRPLRASAGPFAGRQTMDRETLGNVLFLTSLAALSVGCAEGSTGGGSRPGPFMTGAGDEDPGDPWTDPLDTTGAAGTSGADESSDDGGGWPSEGETGQVSSESGDPSAGDGETTDLGTTGSPGGEESGDYASSGYDDEPPPPGGDPCPALAQLYSSCNPEYLYQDEITACNAARAQAQSISAGCGTAHAEYLACLSTLDCGTLLQPGVPFACILQGAATDLVCG